MKRLGIPLAALAVAIFGVMAWLTQWVLKPHAAGLVPFDGRPGGYSLEQAQAYLGALDDTGRALYLREMRWLDTVFPPVLAAVLGMMMLAATRGWHGWARVLLLVPVAGYAVMDLCENALVAELLRSGAWALDAATVTLASEFTQTKWALLIASALLLAAIWLRRLLFAPTRR